MQINNNPEIAGGALGAAGDSSAVQAARTGQTQMQSGGRGAIDQVQLSRAAQLFAAHQDRLDQLQTAVDSGTYHVSPSVIAGSMIREWLAA